MSRTKAPLSLPEFPFRSHSARKISSLYEVEYFTKEEKIQATNLHLVNPYSAYQKPSFSPVKSIKSLITTRRKAVKQYVQSSKFDKNLIYRGQEEQFVTLEIPYHFPQEWCQHGYSHIHFGAVRLALNYHGTSGKHVVSRIALLDSRYRRYQDACIGTVEATLSSGMAMVTLFPNSTMSL